MDAADVTSPQRKSHAAQIKDCIKFYWLFDEIAANIFESRDFEDRFTSTSGHRAKRRGNVNRAPIDECHRFRGVSHMDMLPEFVRTQNSAPHRLKLFADGADISSFLALHSSGEVDGFTTNPTLMFKAGIRDYAGFAKSLLERITDLPISFEVFSDDLGEMAAQARRLASWGRNVYVKIPVTNTLGVSCIPIIRSLCEDGLKLNVTAILTLRQVAETLAALNSDIPSIISIFAGRIADTGRDPVPVMTAAVALAEINPAAEILWASPREALNIHQARACGAHIITATPDILKKSSMAGMDLERLSRDTVKMFRQDAVAAGFQL